MWQRRSGRERLVVHAQARSTNQALPALFCVPFIVKDNFDTTGMAATAGAVALLDNYPAQDAQQVPTALCCSPSPELDPLTMSERSLRS